MNQKLDINWTDVIKNGVNKIEPNMIVNLAMRVIESKQNLEDLKIKGEFFLKALKVHEETVRVFLKNHHEESMAIISALKELIQTETNENLKKEVLLHLVTFGSLSVNKLSEQSHIAFQNIPKIQLK